MAINVIVLSDNDLKFGLTTSSIANADKLLSPDERVLQEKHIQIIYTNVDSNMVRYMKKCFIIRPERCTEKGRNKESGHSRELLKDL